MIDYGKKNVYINSLLSAVYRILSVGISFITLPLLLHCLGTEQYGIWASVLSFVSWIYYLDLGIGGGLRNRLAESLAQKDVIRANGYLNTAYFMLGVLCIGIILIAFAILSFCDIKKWLNYSIYDENINLVILIALTFTCINFVAALVNNIFYATQKAGQVNLYNLIGQILFAIGLGGYLFWGVHELLLVSILEGVSQLIKNLIATFSALKEFTFLKFSVKRISINYTKGVMVLGIQLFIMQIAALILNCTDNLIIVRYFGAEKVTTYNICFKYFGVLESIFVALITPLYSAYTAAYVDKNITQIRQMLHESLCLYVGFIGITLLGGLLFPWCIEFWLRMNLDIPYELIFLIGGYFLLLMFIHNFSAIVNGTGKIKGTTAAVAIEAIINVPISIYLAVSCQFGVNGVILGSIIALCISAVIYPYITLKILREGGK